MSEAPIPLGRTGAPEVGHAPHSLRDDVARLRGRLRREIDDEPLLAVVASLCLGFALGGGVTRGALTLLLGVGARAAGSRLGDTILERAPTFRAAQEDST